MGSFPLCRGLTDARLWMSYDRLLNVSPRRIEWSLGPQCFSYTPLWFALCAWFIYETFLFCGGLTYIACDCRIIGSSTFLVFPMIYLRIFRIAIVAESLESTRAQSYDYRQSHILSIERRRMILSSHAFVHDQKSLFIWNTEAYNDETYPTFQVACAARGLLENDDEWDQRLEEAAHIQTDRQLRQLFVSILLHNDPLDPRSLYEHHLTCLSNHCRYRL